MDFIQDNWPIILGFLLALSEVLALIPALKSNSVFELIYNALKSVASKDESKKLP